VNPTFITLLAKFALDHELTDSLYENRKSDPAHGCPHWRSVFSSVFKELAL